MDYSISKSKRGDRFTVTSSLYTLYEYAKKGLLKKEAYSKGFY